MAQPGGSTYAAAKAAVPNVGRTAEKARAAVKSGKLLNIVTHAQPDYELWTVQDIFMRGIVRPTLLNYYHMFTSPFEYPFYVWNHFVVWYGLLSAVIMIPFILVAPLAIIVRTVLKEAQTQFSKWMAGKKEKHWSDTSIWFVEPKNPLTAMMWKLQKELAPFAAGFWLIRSSREGMNHSWEDEITTKDFWRNLFAKNNVRDPRSLGRWENNKIQNLDPDITCSVVLKITDSFLGIGDKFLEYGKDFKSNKELITIIESHEEYRDRAVLILEWVRPLPSLGVHQLDILTIKTKAGVQAINCVLWCECTGPSSHSAEGGYVVDIETETVVSPTDWYTVYFYKKPTKMLGRKIPGVKAAVQRCIKMHESVTSLPWLRAVGWDCMVTDKAMKPKSGGDPQDMVFFEGNFAHQRFPRRVMLSWATFWAMLKTWP